MASQDPVEAREAREALAEFARERRQSMGETLAELIERERRRAFLEGANADWADLQADPKAWADDWAEHRELEGTLMDGLEDDPWYEAEGSSPEGTSGKWSSTLSGAASRPVAVRP